MSNPYEQITNPHAPRTIAYESDLRMGLSAYIARVYLWMAVGLLATALMAFVVASIPALRDNIYGSRWVFYGLLIVEVLVVIGLTRAALNMPAWLGGLSFLGYSLLNGATLGIVFLVYTSSSIGTTFVITAGMFGAMALYGLTTKRDLNSWASFLFMGLFGILIASVVNIFMGSAMMHWIISIAGVIVFTGLAAYDNQKVKEMYEVNADNELTRRMSILGALTLYLDFINLFLFILRLMGSRRD
jgi:FtsH-binding integral membrane protein